MSACQDTPLALAANVRPRETSMPGELQALLVWVYQQEEQLMHLLESKHSNK
jgi:hypothetical protein